MSNFVPEGWAINQLGKLTDVRSSNVDKKADDAEIPVRLCNYMDVYRNNRITSEIEFMEATAKQGEIDRFSLEKGDVIITKDSETPDDIAVSAYVSESFTGVVCGYHLTLLRPRSNLANGQFLSHLFQLQSVQHYFYILANGTTRFGLTADAINAAPLLTPPLPEQQKIATILSSVDDVIEKTRVQIDKLKDLKTGMMQELLTKGIGHTEFKDSPVGRIPCNWVVLRVSEFLVERKQKGFDNIPIYSVLMNGGMVPRNTVDRRVSSELESSDNRLVLQGDLAYNMMRMWQGASGIAPVDCLVSPAYVVCTPSEQIDSSFLGYLLKNPIAIQKLKRYSQGLTGDRLRLYFESFKQITFAIPPLAEQQKIALALRSVDINISQKMQQLFTRENFKKALMQDLLTGKVRVKLTDLDTKATS